MKKSFKLLILSFTFILVLVLAACDHTHTASETWEMDGDNHWHTCSDCNETLDTNAHTYGEWNITVAATDAQVGSRERTCSVCGYKAVEEIPMTNHTHAYTDTVVAPTCTEQGYTNHVCEGCGDETKINYVPALGHTGSGECDRCHQAIISASYYKTVLSSLLDDEFSIVIKDFELNMPSDGSEVKTGFAELVVTLDENGNIRATGQADLSWDITYQNETETYSGHLEILLENNIVYLYADGASNTDGTYAMYDLSKYTEDCPMEIVHQMNALLEAVKAYQTEIVPAVKALLEDDAIASNELVLAFLQKIFVVTGSDNAYTLTLNFEALEELHELVYTSSIETLVNTLLGDGTYANIISFVDVAFSLKIEDLLKVLNDNGVSIEEVVALVNEILPEICGEGAALDAFLPFLNNETLVQFLNKDEVKSLTIVEFVNEYFLIDISEYKDMAKSYLTSIKDSNAYEMILLLVQDYIVKNEPGSGTVIPTPLEELKASVYGQFKGLLEIAPSHANIAVTTDSLGNVLKYAIDITDIDYLNYQGFGASLTLDYAYESTFDQNAFDTHMQEFKNMEITNEALAAYLRTDSSYDNVQVTEDGVSFTEENYNHKVTTTYIYSASFTRFSDLKKDGKYGITLYGYSISPEGYTYSDFLEVTYDVNTKTLSKFNYSDFQESVETDN